MKHCECPQCGKDISDNYDQGDHELAAGWFCEDCEEFVIDEIADEPKEQE